MTPEEAKILIRQGGIGEVQLLDVRQASEFEREHLPGARHIPLKQLPKEHGDLDKEKVLLVYCETGGRSRAAAQLLEGYGFKEVYNVTGGIRKWLGRKASGPEIQGLDLISKDANYMSGITLSYGLEDGLQKFYARLAEKVESKDQRLLLERLAGFEDKHKAWLAEEYQKHSADKNETATPQSDEGVMEGGRSVDQFLSRIRAEFLTMADIFDMALMFETQAMDLYSRLARQAEDSSARELFLTLVDEEKTHLGYLENEYVRLMKPEYDV